MVTLEHLPFILISNIIVLLTISICIFIYLRYNESSPLLSIIVCGLIIFLMLIGIYNLRYYGIDMGWFPPIQSYEMSNLSLVW